MLDIKIRVRRILSSLSFLIDMDIVIASFKNTLNPTSVSYRTICYKKGLRVRSCSQARSCEEITIMANKKRDLSKHSITDFPDTARFKYFF